MGDVNGNGVTDFVIQVSEIAKLGSGDFLL
jgi:hypothetical protein